ncbi:MAG: segregation/condensation protein A [Planctomycetes bacterium]|nr:segregation/condensation protein A [Planctomycetota bacterium]
MADISEYKLQLENFYGPLDLLLHLVREEEVPILAIPIARIADQYVSYLELMQKLDINLAGEFLVMAATLMVIKARMLVPQAALEEEEEVDPRLELVRKLLEYKRFKDLARELTRLYGDQARRYGRPATDLPQAAAAADGVDGAPPEPEEIQPLEVWKVVTGYAKITKETNLTVPSEILYDVIPIEEVIAGLLGRLREKRELMFSELVPDRKQTVNVVLNFLAVLELTKQQEIETEQTADFGDIRIRKRVAPPPAPDATATSLPPAAPATTQTTSCGSGESPMTAAAEGTPAAATGGVPGPEERAPGGDEEPGAPPV